MRRHVDRHVVDLGRKIGAVVEIEGAEKVLVRLALTGVLRNDESRDVLEYRRRPQQRLVRNLFLADIAGRGGGHIADASGDHGYRAEQRLAVLARFFRVHDARRAEREPHREQRSRRQVPVG